ncbi:MAG TPA: hypothetical protein VHM01_17135, partial [Alphaproteobacteria bacterium]|nr:hypothetical protein [Alphaproteobacteria bacterium]
WRPATVAIGAAVLASALDGRLPATGSASLEFVRKAGLYSLGFMALWLVLPGGLRTLREQGGLLRQVIAGDKQLERSVETEPPPSR